MLAHTKWKLVLFSTALTVPLSLLQSRAQDSQSKTLPLPSPAWSAPSLLPQRSEALLPSGGGENKWGPFEGRVVDAANGESIVGAAVIVFWMRAVPTVVEGHNQFYDSRWAVTSSDGRFTIPRRNPPVLRLGKSGPYLTCVAPGYLPYEFPRYGDRSGSPTAHLQDGGIEIRMRAIPLSRRERLARLSEFEANSTIAIPTERMQHLTAEINKRRSQMLLPPIDLASGELHD